ncbi:MAG: 16S rRNA (guanine(966)-N(2))-methyltransferase RsmD [Phycisphaerae bacterium]
MRVIAGRFRGIPLIAPEGERTRPITDRVKESLFNILGSRFGTLAELPDFDVLDLFAGTGSLGIEALSRGCRSCMFVERDRKAITALRTNVGKLKMGDLARVAVDNVWSMRLPDVRYGLMFLDPPYVDATDELKVIDLLARLAPNLADDGLIVFRYGGYASGQARIPETLTIADERQFGTMHICLLARKISE